MRASPYFPRQNRRSPRGLVMRIVILRVLPIDLHHIASAMPAAFPDMLIFLRMVRAERAAYNRHCLRQIWVLWIFLFSAYLGLWELCLIPKPFESRQAYENIDPLREYQSPIIFRKLNITIAWRLWGTQVLRKTQSQHTIPAAKWNSMYPFLANCDHFYPACWTRLTF